MRYTFRSARLLAGGILLATAATPCAAQVPLTARAVGTGGAYHGLAVGNEAVFYNPAHLALPQNPAWSISLAQIAIGATLLGAEPHDIPDFARYDKITAERRGELLAGIPSTGAEVAFDARLPLVSISAGRFGFGLTYGSVGQHTVGRDLAELLLDGYQEGRADYRVGDTGGSRATYFDFAAAAAHDFDGLKLGITAHYVRGGTLMRSRLFEPRIEIDRGTIELDYLGVLARGGSGYGIDLGAAYQPSRNVTLSAAVTNAIGRMTWSDELRLRQVTIDRADIDSAEPIRMFNQYEFSEEALDPNGVSLQVYETAAQLYEEAYFPAVAQLGATWWGESGTQLTASYGRTLSSGRLAGDRDRHVGFGLQQKIPLVTVRAGYSTDLDGRSITGAGLSLGPMELGVARLKNGVVEGAERHGWMASFGVGVRQP